MAAASKDALTLPSSMGAVDFSLRSFPPPPSPFLMMLRFAVVVFVFVGVGGGKGIRGRKEGGVIFVFFKFIFN